MKLKATPELAMWVNLMCSLGIPVVVNGMAISRVHVVFTTGEWDMFDVKGKYRGFIFKNSEIDVRAFV